MVTVLWVWNGLPLNTYILMYARTNRFYNERGSRTNYVRTAYPTVLPTPVWISITSGTANSTLHIRQSVSLTQHTVQKAGQPFP
jgi:hypothetical protein